MHVHYKKRILMGLIWLCYAINKFVKIFPWSMRNDLLVNVFICTLKTHFSLQRWACTKTQFRKSLNYRICLNWNLSPKFVFQVLFEFPFQLSFKVLFLCLKHTEIVYMKRNLFFYYYCCSWCFSVSLSQESCRLQVWGFQKVWCCHLFQTWS